MNELRTFGVRVVKIPLSPQQTPSWLCQPGFCLLGRWMFTSK